MKPEVEKILPLVQKPGRYTGGELNEVIKNKDEVALRYAFCFPDTYEIGMSHLGIKILYSVINNREDAWCERVFAPEDDMEEQMRKNNIPLYALESGDYIKDFDAIGFTLMYELCYSNVLNMIDLAGLPVLSKDRTELTPIIMAGGACACNPEPIADFVDFFQLGEGEEMMNDVLDLLKECKEKGESKAQFLEKAAHIQGIYVPSLYDIAYNEDGTVKSITPKNGAPEKVKKRLVSDLDNVFYPKEFVVPFIDVVHDRVVTEIFRGCIRGCRFCQACFLNRPIREKSPETINNDCKILCETTGYDEISLCSLSSSDYSQLPELLSELLSWTTDDKINIALPSLRVDNFPDELVKKLNEVRRSGLTFAPEAGTQRLRDVINKNVTEDEVIETSKKAFSGGWTAVKLYFMIGLPTENMTDIEGIADLAQKVVDTFYRNPDKPKGKGVNVSVSVASFVPKPFTPFQWEPQDAPDTLKEKQEHLKETVKTKKVSLHFHDIRISFFEGILARGDRRLGKVILKAWQKGCKFDCWDDKFKFDTWMETFEECGIDPTFYTSRKREFSEILPWDHLDYGIRREFLENENIKAHKGLTTANCREKCSACGAAKLNGGKCDAMCQNMVH
ncbi:MAG: TIGR03960 family B12-binding radical SAM protein [Clostridiales bacterium]|nr:TIGR03960 family B12-binding radical SAM protein [Clostridiales bacterium]